MLEILEHIPGFHLRAYQQFNFLISQAKHMLWVLKRTITMRQFF